MSNSSFKRDLFEIENARNLTRDELVATFVPTQSFWRLLSAKNQIILGARGSGKTAVAKMLAHDHLSRLQHSRAQSAIASMSFLGVYLPTSVEWVGSLKNKPWQTEAEAEEFFQWRLNISACLAFLTTLRSCLDTYIEDLGKRARNEQAIAEALSASWLPDRETCATVRSLQHSIEDVEHAKQQQLARLRAVGNLRVGDEPAGLSFETTLFGPLRRGIRLVERVLNIPAETTWLLCLDEAEFLAESHHRILNTYLRSDSGNLKFKITTMPYKHYTTQTNTGVPVDVGHDFEYVYIDQDPVLPSGRAENAFAKKLFRKRADSSGNRYRNVTLQKLVGDSQLLGRKYAEWGPESSEMGLLREFGTRETVERAERLASAPRAFRDQVARKVHGALLLKKALVARKGREELEVYSGDAMFVRCSDGNPRRFIRLCNSLLLESQDSGALRDVPRRTQARLLGSFGGSVLYRVQSEPECGPELYAVILAVGNYMHEEFASHLVSTDQVSSIVVDAEANPDLWRLVKHAVGLGLLFPNVSLSGGDEMPPSGGTFHLAYALAPFFQILPRRGTARRLALILAKRPDDGQLPLFGSREGERR